MIIPEMGISAKPRVYRVPPTGLGGVLFTPVQQRVLGLLFGQPDRRFQSGELIRLAASGTGAVHRLLTRLADSGLIMVERVGNQKHYQANRASPVFAELHGLIIKTSGLLAPLRAALAPLADRIRTAFVYGSVAKRTDHVASDIDLMVVGTVSLDEILDAVSSVERHLRRSVNPTIYTPQELREKLRSGNHFLRSLEKSKKVFLIGDEDEFREAGATRLVQG